MVQKQVTIVDVASRAGVAISSVSTALNGRPGVSEATRRRIREVADELGFVASMRGKSLSAKRAFAVGLVVQRPTDVLESDPFFASFIAGAESVLAERDYALVLQMASDEHDALERSRRLAADRRVDGIFLSELRIDDPRIGLIQELGLPAVGVNPDRDTFPFPSVRQDHEPGIVSLVNYLIGVGHTNIAHLSGPPEFIHVRQRQDTWQRALRTAGQEPGALFVGDFTYEGGEHAADELLGLAQRPTAVICANDLMAIGLMTRAQDLGLSVPGELSIAGYDGIRLDQYVRPALTSVKTAPGMIGEEAARLLLDQIEGKQTSDVEVAPVELILRGSTGRAPRL